MPLAFLFDEHLRGVVSATIVRHAIRLGFPLDIACVGELPDLPCGASDPEVLGWAEREGRILVTFDRATMSTHLQTHLDNGRHSPGVFILRSVPLDAAAESLAYVAYLSESHEWIDRVVYVP